MNGDQIAAWLNSVTPIELVLIDGLPVATSTHQGRPLAATVGFSTVDTGLSLAEDGGTSVRSELVTRGGVDKQLLGHAVNAAAHLVQTLGVPAQPGVLLEDLLDRVELPEGITVRHGWLREPELFDEGTPLVREPGQLTLLLELVCLTDEEFAIARDQGVETCSRRLRRRGTDVGDWRREG
ncbi:suppressor of fused domain protein [Corynebacterium sp. Marseille-P4321]|uniref:suppressor of fused domain protein n=1 Tax=Corynebacterium sp. Marseille-P4321 TaxID=2736603 RepID=UPI00089336E1|nr:suppressor of fused domain protein [Corynebacterium sp. Marseille-P4321]OEY27027.1 hypothetical protein A0K93_00450 [Corynebacterium sp. BCW_4722]